MGTGEPIDQLRRELRGDKLTPETVAAIAQRSDFVDDRDVALVKTLTAANCRFLTGYQINQIIAAEMTEVDALSAARTNELRYTRLAYFLPEIARYLGDGSNSSLRYLLERLNDLVHDFSLEPTETRRIDKIRNDRIRTLRETTPLLQNLQERLLSLSDEVWALETEYSRLVWAENELSKPMGGRGNSEQLPKDFDALSSLLKLLAAAVHTVLFDIASDAPRDPVRSFRMGKRDVVSLAYDLQNMCKGPPLVTTPGSDISALCGLIYELATGKAEESFAGAIIDFARSQERQNEDIYQLESIEDEKAIETNDNFYAVRGDVKTALESAAWYIDAAKSPMFDQATKSTLTRTASAFIEKAKHANNMIGPFIVWANNEPEAVREKWHAEQRQAEERLREARVLLGRARRSKLEGV